MSEPPTSSRRAFFGRAWRDALAAAPKPFAASGGMTDPVPAAPPAPPPLYTPATAPPPGPTTGAVTLDDLLAHAGDVGLDARAGAIRSLARWSIRLTPAADGRSQLGGEPGLPDGVPWPSADGRPLPCLAQLDLEDVAALGVATQVPADGRLLVFAEPGESPFPRGRLLVVPGPGARGPEPLAVSPELTLPRVWSAPVQDVGLADEERDAWEALRARLAGRQGVELHDRAGGFLALHRLLGYPDETGGDMPLMCALLDAGVVLEDRYARMHPRARELDPRAGRWRLLLQLSVGERERVYVWIAAEDLAAGDLSRVRIIRL